MNLAVTKPLPLTFFDDENFKEILAIHEDGAKITINSTNIKNYIEKTSDNIKSIIHNEVKDKLFSIQFDTASRHGRSFLGINIQYYSKIERKIVVRTLGVIELNEKHTGKNLNIEIGKIFDLYNIEKPSTLAIISDNGANVIAACKKFKELQANIVLNEELEELRKKLLEQMESDFGDEEEQENDAASSYPTSIQEAISKITSLAVIVRCSIHSLQLAVNDTVENMNSNLKNCLERIRQFVKSFKTAAYASDRIKFCIPKIPIDCKTRWNSTYLMISKILDFEENLIKMYEKMNPELKANVFISNEDFNFMKSYKEAFGPAYEFTLKMQLVQLSMGIS